MQLAEALQYEEVMSVLEECGAKPPEMHTPIPRRCSLLSSAPFILRCTAMPLPVPLHCRCCARSDHESADAKG
jgi:hypothetical protein